MQTSAAGPGPSLISPSIAIAVRQSRVASSAGPGHPIPLYRDTADSSVAMASRLRSRSPLFEFSSTPNQAETDIGPSMAQRVLSSAPSCADVGNAVAGRTNATIANKSIFRCTELGLSLRNEERYGLIVLEQRREKQASARFSGIHICIFAANYVHMRSTRRFIVVKSVPNCLSVALFRL